MSFVFQFLSLKYVRFSCRPVYFLCFMALFWLKPPNLTYYAFWGFTIRMCIFSDAKQCWRHPSFSSELELNWMLFWLNLLQKWIVKLYTIASFPSSKPVNRNKYSSNYFNKCSPRVKSSVTLLLLMAFYTCSFHYLKLV